MLSKLHFLLGPAERPRAYLLIALLVLGALAETFSVGAILPLMSVLGNPGIVGEDPRILALYRLSMAPSVERFVLLAALALMMAFLVKNVLLAAIAAYQARFAANLQARVAAQIFEGYLRAPYASRLERRSAEGIRVVTAEVGRAVSGVVIPLISLLTEGFVLLGLVALLVIVDPVASIGAFLVLGGVGYALQHGIRRVLAHHRRKGTEAQARMFHWVSLGLGSLKEAKVLGREAYFIGRFQEANLQHCEAARVFGVANQAPRLVVETLAVWALLGVLVVNLHGGRPISQLVPVLTLFALAAVRMMPSVTRILASLNSVRFHAPAVDTVYSGLVDFARDSAPPGTDRQAAPHCLPRPVASVGLRDVSFRYSGGDGEALRGITFRIARGELVAVVGPSGSGKSTLADLVLGLLEPSEGQVEVNGEPVASLGQALLGAAGLVSQQFFLLDDTVRRNVAFGLGDAAIDDRKVWEALELAKVAERIRQLSGGLDATIREQGALLSGGERQRLAIARALYEDPQILVLDEATSALDAATEAEIMATVRALANERIVFMATHRLANLKACDRVLVMRDGRIIADAQPAELKDHAFGMDGQTGPAPLAGSI